jgi:PST family polysaccharide transporter
LAPQWRREPTRTSPPYCPPDFSRKYVPKNLHNFAALAAIQVSNAALPLIIFPFALKVTSAQNYSALALSEAIALCVLAIALYSFDIEAVPLVVGLDPQRESRRISKLFSSVLYARLALLLVAGGVTAVFCELAFPHLTSLYLSWLIFSLSHVLQSAWLFQGLERNTAPAVATVLSRLSSVVLIVTIVRTPNQHSIIPILVGIPALGSALALFAYTAATTGIKLCTVSPKAIWQLIKSGRTIFGANISVVLYRDMNVLLLDLAGATATAISAYSLAEKFIKSIQATARPLNQLFFPRAVRALRPFSAPSPEPLRILSGLVLPQLGALGIFLGGGLTFIVLVPHLFLPTSPANIYPSIITLMLIMSPAVFLGVFNFMAGTVGLTYLKAQRFFFHSVLLVGALNLPACFLFSRLFGEPGPALSYVLSELLLSLLITICYFSPPGAASR